MGKTDKLTKNIQNAQKTLEEAKKLLEKNKPENALKEVNKSIELNATSKAYILRAQIYCLLGKCTLAFLDCQQVASMSGCTNDIKAQLTELRGDLYYTWGISEAALSEYSNASLAQLSRNSLTSNNTASFEAIPNNSDSGELSIRKEHTEPFLKAELPRKLRALRSSLSIAKESPSYLKASRIPSTNQTDQNLLKIDALRLNYFLTSTVISLLKNTRPELGTAQIFKTQKHWADFQNFFIGVEHTADFVEFFEYNLELLKGELRDRGVSNDNAANILAYDPLRKEFKRLFEEFRQLWLMQVDSKKPNYDPAIEKFADMIDLAGDRYEYIADLELSEFSTSTANSKPDRNSKAISKADNPIIKEIETQAIKGHSTCLYIRAYVHKHGLFGLERSDENAQADYALSSKKNDPRSMFIHRSSTEVIEAKKSEKLQSELLQSAVKKQYIRAILEQSKDFANTNNANRIADLDSAVTQSVAEACYELAGIYTTHFDNLSEQAIQLYLRAIELNYRPACRALARLYKQLARPLEALQKYSEAIYWGDLEVFVELAQELMREKGPLRISDPDLAVTLYAVAHLLGDQTALSSLNTIADNSNVLAALFSALFYYEDHKTLNFKKVTTHLGLAIEAKHGRAAYMSALIDKKDSEKVEHLSIAISLGYTPAWSVLSLIANDQENPVNHYAEHMLALAERNRGNYETAVLWFERCNESDYVNGIFDYARLHEQGHGAFPKNPKTALSLFDKALSLGLGTAAMAITEMHIRGEVIVDLISIYRRGIECKNNDARDCLLKAVSAGDFGARVVLANLYEVGCEPLFAYDLDSAISLMESLVGESGQSEHIHYLATLYEKRDDIAKQPKSNLTIDTYRRAVFLNNEFALKDLLRLADTDNSYAKIVYAKLYDKLVYPSINSEIPKIISLNRGQAVKYYRNSYPMIEDSLNGLFQIALDDAKDSTTSDAYDALKKFSGQNDALAAFYLAYLHMPQNKLLPDIDKALVYLNHSTGLGYQKALDELKAYASTGNNKAQNLLGDIFRLGKGFQQDSKVAVYWYEMAKNEIVDAKFNLACLLRKDPSVMNAKEAFNLFNQLALQAHANARHNCGEMLERGEGVLANLVMAIAEYTISLNADFNLSIQSLVRLSLLGNAEAAYQLGKYYKSRSNLKTAAEYLSTSAERKHPLGNLEMGYAYENGYAVKKDYPTAILYYEASHELSCSQATRELERLGNNGDAEVQSFVGRYYYSIKQYIVAVDWLTKAANLGHLPGIHQLGCLWIEGGNGIEINNKLGLDWLEAAASKNYVASLIELSEIYILGSIVTQDYSRAARLVKVAIEQGVRKYETNLVKLAEVFKNKDAQFYLGELLETGSYLNPDIGRAYQYYRMAADQNHPYACYLVAYYYFNKQDYKTSYYYINQALKLKHEDARYLYAFHLEKGLGVKEDHLKALDQFEKVNGKHRDEALLRRCESYMRGLGYPKDYNKAFNLCTSIKNDEIAGECMARLYCNDAIPEEYYPRAYKIFSITANPTHPYSRFAKARALLRGEGVRKDNELGLRCLKEAIDDGVSDASYTLANIFYNSAMDENPDEKTILLNRKNAIKYYESAAEADHGRALYELSFCYLLGHGLKQNNQQAEKLAYRAAQHGFYSEVFDDIYHAAEIHKRPNETFVNRTREMSFAAYSLADYSQLESILAYISNAIKVSRNYYFYLYLVRADLLVKLYDKTGQKEHLNQALRDINTAFKNPLLAGFAAAYHSRAKCYFHLGQYEQAHSSISDAKLLDFDHHDTYEELAKRCRIEVARIAREKAQKAEDERRAVDQQLEEGKGKLKSKSYEDAAQIFAQVILQQPTYAEAHYQYGMALKSMNKLDEALESLSKALKLQHNFSAAHYAVACVYYDKIKELKTPEDKLQTARLAYTEFKALVGVAQYSSISEKRVKELSIYIQRLTPPTKAPNQTISVSSVTATKVAFFKDGEKPSIPPGAKYTGNSFQSVCKK